MKRIFFLMAITTTLPLISKSQFLNQNFKEINHLNEKKAKDFLTKCQSPNWFSYLINSIKNRKNIYHTVAYYYLSNDAINYDSTKSIVEYLILDNKITISDFIAFRKKSGEYFISNCKFNMMVENNETYYFDGMKKMNIEDTTTITLNNSWVWNKILQQRHFDFLFAVKYFRNAIWFIENKQVYLIDMKELKIYNPDDYIKQKCSNKIIHKLALNQIDKFCD